MSKKKSRTRLQIFATAYVLFHTEDGKVIIGAYIVLDKKDQINGDIQMP